MNVEVALWYRTLFNNVICVASTASAILLVNNDLGRTINAYLEC